MAEEGLDPDVRDRVREGQQNAETGLSRSITATTATDPFLPFEAGSAHGCKATFADIGGQNGGPVPDGERGHGSTIKVLPAEPRSKIKQDGGHGPKKPARPRSGLAVAEGNAYPPRSTALNLAPMNEARSTSVVEIKIMMIPSAESLPHRPSSAKRRI